MCLELGAIHRYSCLYREGDSDHTGGRVFLLQ